MAAAPSFVLVHGAFVDAACWDKVARALRNAGATVATPTNPGAERDDATAAGKVTLPDIVAAIERAVDAAPQPVHLVGHSFGGMVISQVAESRAAKLASITYLSAYYPLDGEALGALAQADPDSEIGKHIAIDQQRLVATLSPEAMRLAFCNDLSDADTKDVLAHYRTQPLQTFGAPVHLTEANFGRVPRFYVLTRRDKAVTSALQDAMVAKRPVKRKYTIDGGHASMLSHDAELARILLEIAG